MNAVPMPYGDPQAMAAWQFLVEEAATLDRHDYPGWLDLVTDDISYEMPVTVTVPRSGRAVEFAMIDHFREDRHALGKRVERFMTQHAWTEDPLSRTRHFVTNVRVFPGDSPDTLNVESYLLLFRSRGDIAEPSTVSAGRSDVLRRAEATPLGWQLARRVIAVDEAVLRTQNLAILL